MCHQDARLRGRTGIGGGMRDTDEQMRMAMKTAATAGFDRETRALVLTLALPAADAFRKEVAGFQLVRLIAEGHYVVALVAGGLQPCEQRRKIDIPLTWL